MAGITAADVKALRERGQVEGYEIDLRLRPYGRAGSMAVPLDSFRRYFALTGDSWPYERQALIKLRPIAGDVELGQKLVKLRDELIYTGEPFDVAAMRAMRERQAFGYGRYSQRQIQPGRAG